MLKLRGGVYRTMSLCHANFVRTPKRPWLLKSASEYDPATPKLLNWSSPKFEKMITSGIPTSTQNFYRDPITVSILRMRDFASYFGTNCHLQPRRHHGHWRKLRQKTRMRSTMCLLGSQNQNFTFIPLSSKNRHFAARFRRHLEILAQKYRCNIWRAACILQRRRSAMKVVW